MTVTTLEILNPALIGRYPLPSAGMPSHLLRAPCDLEVVIPSLNEEGRLPATLAEIVRELSTLEGITSRIVIVDNGSSDRTSEVVDRLTRPNGPELVVIGCSTRGKGAAVRRGITTSQARMIGFLDADLSVSPTVIHEAVRRLQSGQDVVIASRRCEGASYEVLQPRLRRLGGWAFRTAIQSLVPGVADSQCGFKFFSLAAAREIFGDMDVTGFAFDVEVLMRANRLGFGVSELPVSWSDDDASTFNLVGHAPEIARDIVRLHRISASLRRRSRFDIAQPVTVDTADLAPVADAFRAVRLVTHPDELAARAS